MVFIMIFLEGRFFRTDSDLEKIEKQNEGRLVERGDEFNKKRNMG